MAQDDLSFPTAHPDEVDLYLDWLRYLRSAVIDKVDGLTG